MGSRKTLPRVLRARRAQALRARLHHERGQERDWEGHQGKGPASQGKGQGNPKQEVAPASNGEGQEGMGFRFQVHVTRAEAWAAARRSVHPFCGQTLWIKRRMKGIWNFGAVQCLTAGHGSILARNPFAPLACRDAGEGESVGLMHPEWPRIDSADARCVDVMAGAAREDGERFGEGSRCQPLPCPESQAAST